MRIAVVWMSTQEGHWSIRDVEKGISGSKAMTILCALEMAKRGHETFLFTARGKDRKQQQDGFHILRTSSELWRKNPFDVVMAVRDPFPLLGARAPRRVFLANDPACPNLPYVVERDACNQIITLSHYQTERYREMYPMIDPDLFFVSGAGVDYEAYLKPVEKDPFLCIYCSMPERGLRHLLYLWPRIVSAVPQARLLVTGGMNLYRWRTKELEIAQNRLMSCITKLPNTTVRLAMARSELQYWQQRASIMIYPCTYDEVFCLPALECSAARCAIVATRRAALPERVIDGENGYLIDGQPGTKAHDDRFVEAVVKLLTHYELCANMGARGHVLAAKHAYGRLIETWESRWEEMHVDHTTR